MQVQTKFLSVLVSISAESKRNLYKIKLNSSEFQLWKVCQKKSLMWAAFIFSYSEGLTNPILIKTFLYSSCMVLVCSMASLITKYQTCVFILQRTRKFDLCETAKNVPQYKVHVVDETYTILVPSRNVFSLRHVSFLSRIWYYTAHIPHQQNLKFCNWQQIWMQWVSWVKILGLIHVPVVLGSNISTFTKIFTCYSIQNLSAL